MNKVEPSLSPARPFRPIQEALLVNAMSASATGAVLDSFLAKAINTANTTAYDRAIDSVYLSTHIGGSHLHHLIDGQHDLVGAFGAARHALPHDGLAPEVLGTAQHISKDLFSVMGLPVVSIKPEIYHQSADWMQQHLGIAKAWQADLLQINGLELLGGGLSVFALMNGLKNPETKALFQMAGSSGLAGVLAANPIAMVAGAAALVMAWRVHKPGESWLPGVQRGGIGLASTGAVFATGNLLGGVAAGGVWPLTLSLILSLAVGVAVQRWLSRRLKGETQLPVVVPALEAVGRDAWRQHLLASTARLHNEIDEPTWNLLRQAFPPRLTI